MHDFVCKVSGTARTGCILNSNQKCTSTTKQALFYDFERKARVNRFYFTNFQQYYKTVIFRFFKKGTTKQVLYYNSE